jgi:hypothetical protein
LDELEYEFFKALLPSRLILPIDDVYILSPGAVIIFEFLLGLNFNDHVWVDILDGQVVNLLLELEVSLRDGFHIAVEGLLLGEEAV